LTHGEGATERVKGVQNGLGGCGKSAENAKKMLFDGTNLRIY
jgi:hypothetical protein